jgi:D-alanine--poly(phosphoribitol) ligase subunit 2
MTDLPAQIRAFVVDHVTEIAETLDLRGLQIDGDFDFFETGVLDSFGFINLLAAVEEQFHVEMDFSDVDPKAFSTLDGLVHSLVPVDS